MLDDNFKNVIEEIIKYFSSGNLDQAEILCKKAINKFLHESDHLHLLGLVYNQKGDLSQAYHYINKAIQKQPKNSVYHTNIGEVLKRMGNNNDAIKHLQMAVNLNPDFAGARYNLANILKLIGNIPDAINYYKSAIELAPFEYQSYFNLANTLYESGNYSDALTYYNYTIAIKPSFAECFYNMALLLVKFEKYSEAIYHLKEAIKANPNYKEAYVFLAILTELNGSTYDAKKIYKKLLEVSPDDILIQLHRDLMLERVSYSNNEIDKQREQLEKNLDYYITQNLDVGPEKMFSNNLQPYPNLLYQGRLDKEIKIKHAKVFENSFKNVTSSDLSNDHKPHIGFVVTKDNEGIFITFMRGLLNNLSSQDFDISIICSGITKNIEKIKVGITNKDIKYIYLPEKLTEMVEKIRHAKCDILYHWEIGTDPSNYFLPFFKLAPIQCTGIGWPETSGIPSVNYFISNKFMETEHSNDHYTEKLIKFESLSLYYYRPKFPKEIKTKDFFGLDKTKNIYLCVQTMAKIHPEFDQIVNNILKKDKNSLFVMVEDNPDKYNNIISLIYNRFRSSCAEVFSRIIFLPRQNYENYLSLISIADVLLDTIYFSGGNTSYEAMAAGIPVVTLPSELQRSKFTYALYMKMGIKDCIAKDIEDYVNIAVNIANDQELRNRIVKQINEKSDILFEEKQAVIEYTEFFKSVVNKFNK
ncbi:MAG: tetratricopeptide repeat protein [Candidatus Sericytochromatia bacterium]|nr:tetratricopeptide repeat protein [Candidatus Sericytochromatia bacterium]